MTDIVMPRLSDTMEEGTILRWLKGNGEQVARGEDLAEIETDKATMTYQSDVDGILRILVAEGATLAVGEPIARVGAPGEEDASDASQPDASAVSQPDVHAAGEPREQAGGHDGDAQAAGDRALAVTPAGPEGERVRASPLARRIARESGVELHGLSGSGPGGRIVKADVLGAAGSGSGAAARQAPGGPLSAAVAPEAQEDVMTAKGQTTSVELSRTQQTVARRMAESKATIPDFSLQIEVDMEACVKLRGELKGLSHAEAGEQGAPSQGGAPTYNDMVIKACALALREYPRANGSYRDGRLALHSRINVGVAVAAEDALVVPTVFDAEEKSLGEIARETRALAERVRARTITPPELGGGTFTVSNLGMYGVASFTAIINPPQAGILSVGSLAPRAVVHEGAVLARNMMTLTLVCDHRILYGAEAAQFLARIRELLQTPSALTL